MKLQHCLMLRSLSESESSNVTKNVVAWVSEYTFGRWGRSVERRENSTGGFWPQEPRKRRFSNSKDVEEAMAGGLSKVRCIFCY